MSATAHTPPTHRLAAFALCLTELAASAYETADSFYAVLCRKKANNFAIMGRPEVSTQADSNTQPASSTTVGLTACMTSGARCEQEMPIYVCTKKDRVVDVLKVSYHHHLRRRQNTKQLRSARPLTRQSVYCCLLCCLRPVGFDQAQHPVCAGHAREWQVVRLP